MTNPNLFAITDDDEVAENLDYGPGPLATTDSARLSTDFKDVEHDSWFQEVALDGTNIDFTIIWRFSSVKTVAQRFEDAVTSGEPVTWIVEDGGVTTTIIGTWWFSDGAGITAARFDSSGSDFSDDDGFWGAGSVVQADGDGCDDGNLGWGVGNCDGGDSSQELYRNGIESGAPSTIKNFMYIGSFDFDNDGLIFPADNCSFDANPGQEDGDGDGIGDVCDICPAIFSDNTEEAACIAVEEPVSGASCRAADVALVGPPPQEGEVTVEQIVIGYGTFTKPDGAGTSVFDEITPDLRIARTCCGGVFNLGSDLVEWAAGTCTAPTSSWFSSHSDLLQNVFRDPNPPGVPGNLPGSDTCLHDITTDVYYDILWESWSSNEDGGFSYSRDGLAMQAPVVTVPYSDSTLPGQVDILGLVDGDYELCVSASDVLPAATPVDFTFPDFLTELAGDQISPALNIVREGDGGAVFNSLSDDISWAAGTCAAPTSTFYSNHNDLVRNEFRDPNPPGVSGNLPGSDTCLRNDTTGDEYDVLWHSWTCGGCPDANAGGSGFSYTRVHTGTSASVTYTRADFVEQLAGDMITPNLNIFRRGGGGVRTSGTDSVQWAEGTCASPTSQFFSDHGELVERRFRDPNPPGVSGNLPGSDTCLYNVTNNTYYDVLWSSWTCGGNSVSCENAGGDGFAYTRTGPVPGPAVQDCTGFSKVGEDVIGINNGCFDDDDSDGVPNSVDICPMTPEDTTVGEDGCSIDQTCPCDDPWPNHYSYVRCVANVVSDFLAQNLITRPEKRAIVRAARRSSCGSRRSRRR